MPADVAATAGNNAPDRGGVREVESAARLLNSSSCSPRGGTNLPAA